MRILGNIKMTLVAIWLLAWGILRLVSAGAAWVGTALNILAAVAGLVLLVSLPSLRSAGGLGRALLGLWLLLSGLFALLGIGFTGSGVVLALLAIGAGGFLIASLNSRSLTSNLGWCCSPSS